MTGKSGFRLNGWVIIGLLAIMAVLGLNASGALAGRLTDTNNPARPVTDSSTQGSAAAKSLQPQSSSLVISQVYGGGGNSGATYRSDFVELFNPTSSAVSLSGWTVQYASAANAFSAVNTTTLSGIIQPFSYFLVKEGDGANITTTIPLPSPDFTGTIAMSATAAKVALVSSTTVLPCGSAGNRCWPTQTLSSLVDYVGYGTANDWEGSAAAPLLDNTHSDVRGNAGCTDTDNNNTDFTFTAQASFVIHNSQSPANNCGGTATPTPTATFTPAPPGTLTGFLTDDTSGSPIKASMQISGTSSFSQSNPLAGGVYTMTLEPGTYTLLAVASGCYVGQTIPNVTITNGGTTHLDVAFERAGPDAGGYSCFENAGRSYVAASNLVIGPTFDEDLADFNVSVPLTYYGSRYMTGTISSNGFITLGARTTNSSFSNVCMPDTAAPNGIIAPNWDDLQNTAAGDSGVYTDVTGSAPNRTFIVEWRNVKHFTDVTQPYTNTFELQIEEATGDIYMVYTDVNPTANGQESTVGIENTSGTIAKEVQCNTSFSNLHNFMWAGNSIHFTGGPPPSTPTVTPTVTPGGPTFTSTPTVTATHAASSSVVISEFRTRGPNGGNDEFIELYNTTIFPIDISGWKINGSSSCGTVVSTRVTISPSTTIPAYGHFLATNSAGYSGSVAGNQTYSTGISDGGGIALLDASSNLVDEAGMCVDTAYYEGTPLPQFTDNSNRSYERKPGGTQGSAQDTNDNYNDFLVRSASDPQNLSSPPAPPVVPTATPTATCVPSTADVSVGEYFFLPVTTTIYLGQTVRWTNNGARQHTTTSGQPPNPDGNWDSGVLNPGDSFSHTFNTPGTFHYFCAIHLTLMEGDIVVLAGCAPTATPTNTPAVTDTLTPTPTATPTATNTPVLVAHVTFQNIPQPSVRNITEAVTLILKSTFSDSPNTVYTYTGFTDASGFFTAGVGTLPSGVYNVRFKGSKNLSTCVLGVNLTGATQTNVEMGTTKGGDANNTDIVNAQDFSILAGSFGKQFGQPGYNAAADFDQSDIVNASDFVMLAGNFQFQGCTLP